MPRVQIISFDTWDNSTGITQTVLYPTQKLFCLSDCSELKPQWKIIDGSALVAIDPKSSGTEVVIKTTTAQQDRYYTIVDLSCESGANSKKLKFVVPSNITWN